MIPDARRFLTQLAAAMDDRRRRIGEHAAAGSLPWAAAALGAPPDDPAARLDWQQRAAAIGAYRELSGHDHPDDPVGPEPATGGPDLRAAWHEARAALTPDQARDVRHPTDGQLLNLRAACPARHPDGGAVRWQAPPGPRRRPRREPGSAARVRRSLPRPAAAASTTKQPGRKRSPPATRPCATPTAHARPNSTPRHGTSRQRSAKRAGGSAWPRPPTPNSASATPASSGPRSPPPNRYPPPGRDATVKITNKRSKPALGAAGDMAVKPLPAPVDGLAETSRQVQEAAARHRDLAARLTERHSMAINAEDPVPDISPAFPLTSAPGRTAILQPPKPEIQPSTWVLERVARRDPALEAAD